jgi:hypothetical protein
MIKKLRNQLYAPKSGASSQMGGKRKKKKKEYEERIVNDVAHRRYKSSKVIYIQCNRTLKYNIVMYYFVSIL